tara:strand:+ start:468 stop:614 length:147 start_codon:yes stop_codon:yes gene_type:complete
MSDKWSIQISKKLQRVVKNHCLLNGYKISGYLEKLIKSDISGSINSEK